VVNALVKRGALREDLNRVEREAYADDFRPANWWRRSRRC
jgi:hypothetical protein